MSFTSSFLLWQTVVNKISKQWLKAEPRWEISSSLTELKTMEIWLMKIHMRWNGTTSNSDLLVNFLLLLQQCTKISEKTLFRFFVLQITLNERRAWTKTNSSKIYFIITLGPSEKYHTNLYENGLSGFFL